MTGTGKGDFIDRHLKPGKKRLTIYLSKDIAKLLKVEAAQKEIRMSDLVEESLKSHLKVKSTS